jgi:uncharacterized protein
VLILLAPSESKATRARGAALDLAKLSLPGLTAAREAVLDALGALGPDAATLGVSPNLTEELARNGRLRTAPTLPAGELYTGVLYDALDLASLDPPSRRRANRRLLVASALFGALRPADRVPPYRLAMGVSLPGVGPLAAHWRAPLAEHLGPLAAKGLVVDCRSGSYAAAWAPPAERWVQVRVPGATHLAKRTRGLVARALCETPADPRRPQALPGLLEDRFDVALHAPERAGRPWVLDALERA